MNNSISTTEFLSFPDTYQYRPHLCKEFARFVGADIGVLLLECRPGIGATSLCAEYYTALGDPAILLTLHAGSRVGYSTPYIVAQGLRQAHIILGTQRSESSEDSVAEWHRTLMKLQRHVRSSRQKLHLIIDGLYQIPAEDDRILKELLKDLLFLGSGDIKHILTWREESSLPQFLARASVRRVIVPPLSELEARHFLEANSISAELIPEIVSSTGCVPAKLTSVVRLQKLGLLDKLQLEKSLSEYYDLEWLAMMAASGATSTAANLIFSFIAFSRRQLTVAEVSKFVADQDGLVDRVVANTGAIFVNAEGRVEFSSNTHRNYVTHRLADYRTEIIQRFVEELIADSSSPDSIQLLPNYYEELGRDRDTISVLTPTNLDNYLAASQSLSALRRRNELGFLAASRIEQDVSLYRFALQNSIVRSLEAHQSNEARLAALAALGRLDDALDLAQTETTKEGRLRLLAQYASALNDRNLQVDSVIAENIRQLIGEVDLTANRDRAFAVAERLVGPFPDLAFEIIEQSSAGAKSYQDAAFTRLALKNQIGEHKDKKISSDIYRSKISDATMQGLLRASEAVFGTKSAKDIKASTSTLEGKSRSFFLLQWIRLNYRQADALEISEYALEEVARDPSYLPTAADLRDICLPIPEAVNLERARSVLARIEIQQAALLDLSPTVDKIRLEVQLIKAKTALGLLRYDDAFDDLYLKIGYFTDDAIKLECFCWARSGIETIKNAPSQLLETFRKLFDEEIERTTERCLTATAEHVDVFKGAVAALADSSPAQALALVAKLNTEERRDKAYRIFAEALLNRRSRSPIPIAILMKALNAITASKIKWPAVVSCLSISSKSKPQFDAIPSGLVALGNEIDDPVGRGYALQWSVGVADHYKTSQDVDSLIAVFNQTIAAVDASWLVPEITFMFVRALALVNKDKANLLFVAFEKANSFRKYESPDYADLVAELARLAVIAYAGTIKQKLDTDESFLTIIGMIDRVPSAVSRSRLLSDLAVRAHSRGRKDILDRVCDNRIMPMIRNFEAGAKHLYCRVIDATFLALHLWNSALADSLIADWREELQDDVRFEVVTYRLVGTPHTEPYSDDHLRSSRISWPVAMIAIEQIEKMSTDNLLVESIERFCNALLAKGSVSEISANQRAVLGGRLAEKIKKALPQVKNVKHDGWRVVAQGHAYRLLNDVKVDRWTQLIADAKAIPNASDAVFVLSSIAVCVPPKLGSERIALINEAEARLKLISSRVDGIRRAISMSRASSSAELEDAIAKRLLTKAMQDSLLVRDSDAASEAQREIIDQAYQMDPAFAESLTELIDDDPARVKARALAKSRLEVNRTKGAVAERRFDDIDDSPPAVGQAGWDMLGSLNANKVPATRQDELRGMLSKASRADLDESLGFYWWYLRNLQQKYDQNKGMAEGILLPLFEVTRLAALLAERVAGRVCGAADRYHASSMDAANLILQPGLGIDGLAYIIKWFDEQECGDYIICDPYFKIENIDFIKELSFLKDECEFVILSCSAEVAIGDLELKYQTAWSKIAHVQPPPLKAVHVTYDGDKSKFPIHDRWLLGPKSGLRIGTSVGSLGGAKVSEISRVSETENLRLLAVLQPFIDLKERTLEGRRLKYSVMQW